MKYKNYIISRNLGKGKRAYPIRATKIGENSGIYARSYYNAKQIIDKFYSDK